MDHLLDVIYCLPTELDKLWTYFELGCFGDKGVKAIGRGVSVCSHGVILYILKLLLTTPLIPSSPLYLVFRLE